MPCLVPGFDISPGLKQQGRNLAVALFHSDAQQRRTRSSPPVRVHLLQRDEVRKNLHVSLGDQFASIEVVVLGALGADRLGAGRRRQAQSQQGDQDRHLGALPAKAEAAIFE